MKKFIKKRILLLVLSVVFTNPIFGQIKAMRINFCDEMLKRKENNIMQFKLIHEKDTFIFPQIGDKTFLNPINYYQINIDSSQKNMTVLFENAKYIYILDVNIDYFFWESPNFCITNRKFSKEYVYYYGGTYWAASYAKRYKKTR